MVDSQRRSMIALLVIVIVCAQISTNVQAKSEQYPCRFADDFNNHDFESSLEIHFRNTKQVFKQGFKLTEAPSDSMLAAFLRNVSYWEGKFAVHGVGLNMFSGFTYDGHQIDYETSKAHDPLHDFTASSKESIHVNLMAHALNGNEIARNYFLSSMSENFVNTRKNIRSYNDAQDVDEYILSMLKTKLQSYEAFDNRYPGFGGMLPWFRVTDQGAELLNGWTNTVPSLDNGQLIWGLIGLSQVMRQKRIGMPLADKIDALIQKIRRTVLPIFYQGEGHIRCVTQILNVTGSPFNASNYRTSGSCFLDDPYEGELMAFFMDLLSDWKAAGYNQNEREKIWIAKRSKLKSVKYHSKNFGDIVVEQGYWYSSHEKWKYLVLPYRDIPVNSRVFMNGERARLINSIENKIPGLYASVTLPTRKDNYSPDYASACGIQQIASQLVQYTDVVTPYGAFPVILADPKIGLMWYLNMIKGSKMQGIYGSTESTNITGNAICPVVTWDSKMTTLVAMCGGISEFTSLYMKQNSVYDRFYEIVDREWTRVFGSGPFVGEDIPFDQLRPTHAIPQDMEDFSLCLKLNR